MKKILLIAVVLVGLSACTGTNNTEYNTGSSYTPSVEHQYDNNGFYGYNTGW